MNKISPYLWRVRPHLGVFLLLAAVSILTTFLSVYTSPHLEGNNCFSSVVHHLPITHKPFVYYANCDSKEFINAGKGFPSYFINHTIRMSRPGYPALEHVLDKLGNAFTGLSGALILNLVFAFGASVIFYMLVRDYFDKKTAIFSALLLVLSTHFRIFLGQAHTEVAGDFVIIFSLFLLHHYMKKPSPKRLVCFSLISGFLMLIKLVFALPIFFLILAIKYRKIKEYFVYGVFLILPTFGWYLYVTKILKAAFVSAEVSLYQEGTWFLNFLPHPSKWSDLARAFVFSNGLFLIDILLAFLVIIPFLSIYGLRKWRGSKDKYFWYVSFISSFALMIFLLLWGGARLAFGVFPFVIPFAVFGFFELWNKYKTKHSVLRICLGCLLALLVISVSFINVYNWIPSYDNDQVRSISNIQLK